LFFNFFSFHSISLDFFPFHYCLHWKILMQMKPSSSRSTFIWIGKKSEASSIYVNGTAGKLKGGKKKCLNKNRSKVNKRNGYDGETTSIKTNKTFLLYVWMNVFTNVGFWNKKKVKWNFQFSSLIKICVDDSW